MGTRTDLVDPGDPDDTPDRAGDGPVRLLVVPGLHDSPPQHWQSWLQSLHRHSVRVVQRDWSTPDLDAWTERISDTLRRAGPGPWLAVAHSFGVLALVRHLADDPGCGVAAALLAAPADPAHFDLEARVPARRLPISTTMLLSTTDPWLVPEAGERLARRWGSQVIRMGDAGHLNVASGHGTLPLARRWLMAMTPVARDIAPAAIRRTPERWAFAA